MQFFVVLLQFVSLQSAVVALQLLMGCQHVGSFSVMVPHMTYLTPRKLPKVRPRLHEFTMSGARRHGSRDSIMDLFSGKRNYNSAEQKVRAAGVVWRKSGITSTRDLSSAVKDMLDQLPSGKPQLAEDLKKGLTSCVLETHDGEPAFSAALMAQLAILGRTDRKLDKKTKKVRVVRVYLTDTLFIRTEVLPSQALGQSESELGLPISPTSRVDIALMQRVDGRDLMHSSVELKAGSEGPHLVQTGYIPRSEELGGNALGPLSQQLSYTIKTTIPTLRIRKGYSGVVTTAVISCKSSGKSTELDKVRAARFRIKPPDSYHLPWEACVIESVEGNSKQEAEAAASMLVTTLTEGLILSRLPTVQIKSRDQPRSCFPVPVLGPLLPGTRLLLSPFFPEGEQRITQGELLEVYDTDAFKEFLPTLPISVFGEDPELEEGDVVKLASAQSVISWANSAQELRLALGAAAAIPDVCRRVRKVIKFAGQAGLTFFIVMPNLQNTTKEVTRELLRSKWDLFFQQIVAEMLFALLEKGVIYYDLRTARTNVRWIPPCDGNEGEFLLWDLDSLREMASLVLLPEDGRLPMGVTTPVSFIFAQVLLVAFSADKNIEEDLLLQEQMIAELKVQQGTCLWMGIKEQPDIPLVKKFNAWIHEQEQKGCVDLRATVQLIREGKEIDRACLNNLSQLKLS